MSNDLNLLRSASKYVLSSGALLLSMIAGAPAANGDHDDYAATQPYTWSAELVEFDAGRNVATFRAMFASHVAGADSEQLEPGEDIYLTWSGLRFANAVRSLAQEAANVPASLTLPVRFEGLHRDGRYVTFSLDIADEHAETLRSLQPGHWVTATSPRFPFDSQEAVVAIRPYNDVE